MILVFYNIVLVLALVLGAPWWIFRIATTKKYRQGLWDRLGRVPPSLARTDLDSACQRPVIWLHAVSVGEVLAASRLVEELAQQFPDYRLLISTTTLTGQTLARERFGDDCVFYCPLDLPWAVRSYLNALHPSLLILAETEFWPNLLSGCLRRGIPVVVVNARISDRSWPRYRRFRWFWRPFLSRLSRVLAQSEADADRLKEIGCAEGRVSVAGNLKFDIRAAQCSEATELLQALKHGLRLVVAGSTLEGEEAALLGVWPRLLEEMPGLALVIAPRHPERFDAVARLLKASGYPWKKRSEWRSEPAGAIKPLRPGQVVLLDSIGELASVYSLAAVAFVGGSLVPAGGHNPLEPAQFGAPIVMGPYYANFRAITEDLLAHDALRIAENEELAEVLVDLLLDRPEAEAIGIRGKEVFEQHSGATGRCLEALRELLGDDPPQALLVAVEALQLQPSETEPTQPEPTQVERVQALSVLYQPIQEQIVQPEAAASLPTSSPMAQDGGNA